MILYVSTNNEEREDVRVVGNVDVAMEMATSSFVESVILSDEVSEVDQIRIRKLLPIINNEAIILNSEAGLDDAITRLRKIQLDMHMQQYSFTETTF